MMDSERSNYLIYTSRGLVSSRMCSQTMTPPQAAAWRLPRFQLRVRGQSPPRANKDQDSNEYGNIPGVT
jgi:hypothetical protein